MRIQRHWQWALLLCLLILVWVIWILDYPQYTLIAKPVYVKRVKQSQQDIIKAEQVLPKHRQTAQQVSIFLQQAAHYFANRPYGKPFDQGEGDWCSSTVTEQHCVHINQEPLFRTDRLVCNSYVQLLLALLHSTNLQQFQHSWIKTSYGTAHFTGADIHYYNRNNFMSVDFNPVNRRRGWIEDVTLQQGLSQAVLWQRTVVDRGAWFAAQQTLRQRHNYIRLLDAIDAPTMTALFSGHYPQPFFHFLPVQARIDYLKKSALVFKDHQAFKINYKNMKQLYTPSLVEWVRDDRIWQENSRLVKNQIHSGILVSHVGVLFRQHFSLGQLIYQQIDCQSQSGVKRCQVLPHYCHQSNGCNKLMLSQATQAYPDHYYFYADSQGQYHCQARKPTQFIGSLTRCNRVETLPLSAYLLRKQNGHYLYLDNPSLLGIHLEKILPVI